MISNTKDQRDPDLVLEPEQGYRHNHHSLLLAEFVTCLDHQTVIELGCGSGLVSLSLCKKFPNLKSITALDCNGLSLKTFEKNLRLNDWLPTQKIKLVHLDWREPISEKNDTFDVIVSNPPWYDLNSGRPSPNPQKVSARHEVHGTLNDWAKGVRSLSRPKTKVFMVYTSFRLLELIKILSQHQITIKTLQFVHGNVNHPAKSVLIEAVYQGKEGLIVKSPQIIESSIN